MSDHDELHDDPFRLLGRITAGVAHDLNNYLTVVQVAFDLLAQGDGDALLWARARDAIDSAIGLNRNLVEYARGSQPEPRAIDLGALVKRVLGIVDRMIPPSIVVVVDEGAHLPEVRGVAPELEQLLLNLVINACDAMPRGGELRIRLRARGTTAVVMEIIDTGSGSVRAFDSDVRTPSSKPGRNGHGLGLGIVRSVVARHRAALDVRPREGGGTIVSVTLEG